VARAGYVGVRLFRDVEYNTVLITVRLIVVFFVLPSERAA
jgi:hypothetical protein